MFMRWHRIGICAAALAGLVLAGALSAGNPARVAQDKDPKKGNTIGLHLLEKNAGAHFGDWAIWRYDEGGKSLFLINQKTRYAIYLPWTSNGWVNYRSNSGEWYVLFSKGEAKPQNRDDLKIAPFLDKKPAQAIEHGTYKFVEKSNVNGKDVTILWTVKVTPDLIDFHCDGYDDRMTIRRASGQVIHNGRTFGAK
ncbi:MAG: hypothetical protein HYX68_25850 [Planctomycetes bacterium]|nr:hypothetical protein [Planctomycetota bacterium]